VNGFVEGDSVACAVAGYAKHAGTISVPSNLAVKVPSNLSFREACFATVGAIALQGVRRADLTLGEKVVVIGTGLIGLLTAQILRANGCAVICIDLSEARLAVAKRLGFENVLLSGTDITTQSVLDLTENSGADAVIVTAATKSSKPVNDAFKMCRERGRVVVVGAVGMELEREEYYRKEIDLRISRSYGPGRYDSDYEYKGLTYPLGYVRWTETRNIGSFLDLLALGNVKVDQLISAEYSIDQAMLAYEEATSDDAEVIGVVLTYPEYQQTQNADKTWRLPSVIDARDDRVKLMLVGPGHFAKAVHLPNLKVLSKKVVVQAVVGGSGGSARQAAEKIGAPIVSTDISDVILKEDLDAVLISTRHNLHRQQCIAAAEAGKHIFVEKPLGLTVDECIEVLQVVEKAQVLCTIGFNRRFSSLSVSLRDSISNVTGPKQIIYRVNAGRLPQGHWLLDPEIGGGRLIGEGCHFFDFMSWMLNADASSVTAQSTGDSADDVSVVVKYNDGSVGTLIYTALGSVEFSKERIEIYAGGGVGVIDDFLSLSLHHLPGKSRKLRVADKGHLALLDNFLSAILGDKALSVNALDGLKATLCAQAALESLSSDRRVSLTSNL
ncbi:MAG: bi-domain-containing oxidoreductase, partial [Chloroflexota bacterium]|nr:bi-domain-containing oxidoreductase [Chloroflexota bacterium]